MAICKCSKLTHTRYICFCHIIRLWNFPFWKVDYTVINPFTKSRFFYGWSNQQFCCLNTSFDATVCTVSWGLNKLYVWTKVNWRLIICIDWTSFETFFFNFALIESNSWNTDICKIDFARFLQSINTNYWL